ncbi:hypothetical protein CMK19_00630 [Candidatus Poribacteria bacterium]|nr:hypothetical protein [Candidatus Poribacteria bacterium]
MKYINLTPHSISMNDGTIHPPSGEVARVSVSFTSIVDGLCKQTFGEIENLPTPQPNTRYIVSGLVLSATNRVDVVAPATGHPETKRNDKGHIISVPCFVSH